MVNAAVISVNLYILFIVASQWLLIYQPLEIGSGQIGYLYLIFYHFLVFMLYYSYWQAIVTPPGNPPNNWLPEGKTIEDLNVLVEQYSNPFNSLPSKSTTIVVDDIQSDSNGGSTSNNTDDHNSIGSSGNRAINNVNNNNNSKSLKTRFCTQCKIFKPPRSHHCKKCKKCVLKQDHHCPWIDNCTGFKNQKFFLLFLFYVVILGALTIMSLVIGGFYILNFNLKVTTNEDSSQGPKFVKFNTKTIDSSDDQIPFMVPGAIVTVLFILNLSSAIPVVLGVLGLLFYQIDFLLSNYTSIERFERKSLSKYSKKNGLKFHWRYDRGVRQNFREVFGESRLYWLIPVGIPKSDGTYWKTMTVEEMQILYDKDNKDSMV
ncbi:hypothetical protein CYY_003782 [Polysphondylium violaceum]|uniref:Palmitoyltransferase n=1 Tax=Polysphondylium violaceum TaxID=133409 RepID=A0A8J4PW95_9MYCE|nr:hypothetical protein CYY_003782 [Polysphondylium violaceum]